jgi:fructokinase
MEPTMKYDVIALGELLIDFTDDGISDSGNPLFEANPGGAPGNVLAMLSKLGRNTAFIGRVGDDFFGHNIVSALELLGIDTTAISYDKRENTTLAFVNNKADGEREFTFLRNPGADTQLSTSDIPLDMLSDTSVFHFGSLSLTREPARTATYNAVATAKKAGAIISFDPNLRPLLWNDFESAREQIGWGCGVCDLLKMSDAEVNFLTGRKDTKAGANYLRAHFPNIKMLFITKGKQGSEGYWGDIFAEQPTFMEVDTIDTTGAGDAFFGSCLSFIIEQNINCPKIDLLEQMLLYANAAASLVTTKRGALCAMPDKTEIERLIGRKL